jgi:putative ABC transport system permease protein
LALVATRALSQMLFDVHPSDPATITGVALLLLAAASVAVLIPARRATQVDPLIALRCE